MDGRNGESPEPASLAYATKNKQTKKSFFKHGAKQVLTPKGWSPTYIYRGCGTCMPAYTHIHTHTNTNKHIHTHTSRCMNNTHTYRHTHSHSKDLFGHMIFFCCCPLFFQLCLWWLGTLSLLIDLYIQYNQLTIKKLILKKIFCWGIARDHWDKGLISLVSHLDSVSCILCSGSELASSKSFLLLGWGFPRQSSKSTV